MAGRRTAGRAMDREGRGCGSTARSARGASSRPTTTRCSPRSSCTRRPGPRRPPRWPPPWPVRRIHGVVTNRDLLVRTLRHPAFVAGADRHRLPRPARARPARRAAGRRRKPSPATPWRPRSPGSRRDAAPRWVQPRIPSGWRSSGTALQEVTYDTGGGQVAVGYAFDRLGPGLAAPRGGRRRRGPRGAEDRARTGWIWSPTASAAASWSIRSAAPSSSTGPKEARRSSSGTAIPHRATRPRSARRSPRCPAGWCGSRSREGDDVEAGQILVVLEAMKMEHAVHAATAGTVVSVGVAEGDQVETGRVLAVVDADGDGAGGDSQASGRGSDDTSDRSRPGPDPR